LRRVEPATLADRGLFDFAGLVALSPSSAAAAVEDIFEADSVAPIE
jgi:hypothetical protein